MGQISVDEMIPGDVIWTGGHVRLYIGEYNGKKSIAHASTSKGPKQDQVLVEPYNSRTGKVYRLKNL